MPASKHPARAGHRCARPYLNGRRRAAGLPAREFAILRKIPFARSVLVFALAGILGACCHVVSAPETATPGQGSCAAYVPITNPGGGGRGPAENR
jgi:hypothetical protein